jgi:catechol 2,3-dioxygenase-like lactoylglutathione lyase family enzyme
VSVQPLPVSPAICVIGVSDLAASLKFWTSLGFVETDRRRLSLEVARTLYGLDSTTEEVLLAMPDSTAGLLRLVVTSEPHPTIGPYDRGPHAIDLYTTDIAKSLAIATGAGANTGFGQLDYQFGPVRLQEGKCIGPDGVILVFVDISRRRPSLLDQFPDRLHSEIHSVVNIVASVDAANATWKEAGLAVIADAVIDTPELGKFLQLPSPDRCRMSLLASADVAPIRFEQLGFIDGGASAGVDLSTWPLPAGLPLVEFLTSDLTTTTADLRLAGHLLGPIVSVVTGVSACTGQDAIGQRYLIRSAD